MRVSFHPSHMRALAGLRVLAAASLSAALLPLVPASNAFAQAPAQQTETLTGIVKSDSGMVIPNAQITVTPAGAGFSAAVTVRSNTLGRWTANIPSRAAEYFVTISAIGWIQSRTTAKSSATGAPVVVDVALKKAPVG